MFIKHLSNMEDQYRQKETDYMSKATLLRDGRREITKKLAAAIEDFKKSRKSNKKELSIK